MFERGEVWAATMAGYQGPDRVRRAHKDSASSIGASLAHGRPEREADEDRLMAPGATRASGAGTRARVEEPDDLRTCFERDRDRILHSSAFRRLAGKTQVFVFPDDHQRTRLTHALEVAQVATAVARALRLNVALTEAIALGHDCGHGPGGHASEDAFQPYVAGGYDHATWGADVVLAPLNLTEEVLDGVRNHSWSRPAPQTPEGEVVSWADRIAYCAHDLEDAIAAGVVSTRDVPRAITAACGADRSVQLRTFVTAMVTTSVATGTIAMGEEMAEALAALRRFNYERLYSRPEADAQARAVVKLLRALVDHLALVPDAPLATSGADLPAPGSEASVHAAVAYVAGMTDRYACESALRLLRWPVDQLPHGFDLPIGRSAGRSGSR